MTPSARLRATWYRSTNVSDRIEGRLQVYTPDLTWKVIGVISCQRQEWLLVAGILMGAGVSVVYDPPAEVEVTTT